MRESSAVGDALVQFADRLSAGDVGSFDRHLDPVIQDQVRVGSVLARMGVAQASVCRTRTVGRAGWRVLPPAVEPRAQEEQVSSYWPARADPWLVSVGVFRQPGRCRVTASSARSVEGMTLATSVCSWA